MRPEDTLGVLVNEDEDGDGGEMIFIHISEIHIHYCEMMMDTPQEMMVPDLLEI